MDPEDGVYVDDVPHWRAEVAKGKAEDSQWGHELISGSAPEGWPCWEFVLGGRPRSLPAIMER